MKFHRFEAPGLAHYSYLLGCGGQAVIVDPARDIDIYLAYAAAHNFQISHVLETHIHADYASGALELAQATGAELRLSGHDQGEEYQYGFPHREIHDGEELVVGGIRLQALHTPGHTPEHLSFLVHDLKRSRHPKALLSGDFVFVGSLGRPDLLGEGAKRKLAESLFESVHHRIAALPDGLQIFPAHGAGSLCGSGMSEDPHSTLGYERLCNVYFADKEKSVFVNRILENVPPFPDYYRRMKRVNAEGAPALHGLPGNRPLALEEFRRAAGAGRHSIIDLRRPEAFGGAHVPGAYNIGAGSGLSSWAAWVVPYDRPILLVGEEGTDYGEAIRALIRVGLDNVEGYLKGGIRTWIEAGLPQEHVEQIAASDLNHRSDKSPFILDVRNDHEWRAGHIEGATHIMAGELPRRARELPANEVIHVICASGYRSSLAASILKSHGLARVVNVAGGMNAWRLQRLPERQPDLAAAR